MNWRLALSVPFLIATSAAQAGIYGDDLSKCLILKSTDADKAGLVRWIYGVMSASPTVKDMTSMTAAQHKALNVLGASVFERLVFNECRAETIAALKYEGQGAFEAAFNTLGQVAMRGLMTDPAVSVEMSAFGANFSRDKWNVLAKEAGLPVPGEAAGQK
jgi:hypothetical protein